MAEYHDDPEGPEEINPAYIAENATCHLLLKNPESYTVAEDGTKVYEVDVKWLEWSPVPLIADPEHCRHGFSICYECADEWGTDYYIRFFENDQLVWQSPDYPTEN